LKYTGVLETTKIRRLGYSNRISYTDFVKRYSILVNPLKPIMSPSKENCHEILQKLGLKNWKIGKTKIFLKYYHAEQLTRLYEDLNHKIVLIQSAVRRWLARRLFVHQRTVANRSATIIQAAYRGYRVRKLNKELKECKSRAASLLQAQIRGYLARLRFKKMAMEHKMVKTGELRLLSNQQLMVGGNGNQRVQLDLLLKSVRTIQSHWRGYVMRKIYRDLRIDIATKAMQFGYFCEQVKKKARMQIRQNQVMTH
jgi:myosin-3